MQRYHKIFITILLLIITIFSNLDIKQAAAKPELSVIVTQVDPQAFPHIRTHVSVLDPNGLPMLGLSKNEFSISEDSLSISDFDITSNANSMAPLTFAVAIDTSGSMRGKPLDDTLEAVSQLIDSLHEEDEVILVTFNDNAELVLPATKDKKKAKEILKTLTAKGDTALWDGAHLSLTNLFLRTTGRSALVVVSDGYDTDSVVKLDDVVLEATEHHLPVFSVGFGKTDQGALTRLATLTGGQAFFLSDSSDLSAKFEQILDRMRPEYIISYLSKTLADDGKHQFVAKVSVQGSTAESPETDFISPAIPFTIQLDTLKDNDLLGIGITQYIAPHFSEHAAIQKVEYILDTNILATIDAAPFEWNWTPQVSDLGPHILNIRAYDRTNNKAEYFVQIDVVRPIQVEILQPGKNAQVAGKVTLQASVTGLRKISKVDFYIDDKLVGSLTDGPYSIIWDTNFVIPGKHNFVIKAVDDLGNSAESAREVSLSLSDSWILAIVIFILIISLVGIVFASKIVRTRRIQTVFQSYPVQKSQSAEESVAPEKRIRVYTHPLKASEALAASSPNKQFISAWISLQDTQTGQEKVWELDKDIVTIGGQPEKNLIVISGRGISPFQAAIRNHGDQYSFTSINKEMPTFINDQEVMEERHLLKDGDQIVIGAYIFVFHDGDRGEINGI